MEQMVKPAPLERVERVTTGPPLVFLDTQVILDYLRGKPAAVRLFDSEAANRLRLAINPIVAQELLLSADGAVRPALGRIVERMKMLPVDFAKVEKMVSEAARALQALPAESPRLKKRLAHSNDFIILSSAEGDTGLLRHRSIHRLSECPGHAVLEDRCPAWKEPLPNWL